MQNKSKEVHYFLRILEYAEAYVHSEPGHYKKWEQNIRIRSIQKVFNFIIGTKSRILH